MLQGVKDCKYIRNDNIEPIETSCVTSYSEMSTSRGTLFNPCPRAGLDVQINVGTISALRASEVNRHRPDFADEIEK